MMAESAKAPLDSPDWIFEIKLDGYRAITGFDSDGKPHLWSRNGLALEAKFPAVATAVSKLKLRSTILDGEVVVAPASPAARPRGMRAAIAKRLQSPSQRFMI